MPTSASEKIPHTAMCPSMQTHVSAAIATCLLDVKTHILPVLILPLQALGYFPASALTLQKFNHILLMLQ